FFVTYNDRVIASDDASAMADLTYENVAVSGKPVKLYKYDWLKVRDKSFQNEHADDYCIGSTENLGACTWPLTEQTGSFHFDFDPVLLITLGTKATNGQHKFGFIITGDNDEDSDCYHSKIEFSITVKYYIPGN